MGDDYGHLWKNGFGHQGEVAYIEIPNCSELPTEFMTGAGTSPSWGASMHSGLILGYYVKSDTEAVL